MIKNNRTQTYLVLGFAFIFPTFATWFYFEVLAQSHWVQILYGASKFIQFSLPLAWILWVQKRKLLLSKPSGQGAWIGMGSGLLVVVILSLAYFGYLKGSGHLAATLRSSRVSCFLGEIALILPHNKFSTTRARWGYLAR